MSLNPAHGGVYSMQHLLVEETGVPTENYRPVVSQGQTLSNKLSTMI
jgi:hypothetical protein